MSIFRKRKKSRGALETEYGRLGKEKEKLDQERENIILKAELRKQRKEVDRLKHPHQEEARRTAKRAGGRLLGFMGDLAREGSRSFAKTSRHMKRGRKVRVPRTTQRSFSTPTGSDISLSGAIAREDWSGEKNVMSTDFFGNEYEKQEKDFFGKRSMDNLVGEKDKNNYI